MLLLMNSRKNDSTVNDCCIFIYRYIECAEQMSNVDLFDVCIHHSVFSCHLCEMRSRLHCLSAYCQNYATVTFLSYAHCTTIRNIYTVVLQYLCNSEADNDLKTLYIFVYEM